MGLKKIVLIICIMLILIIQCSNNQNKKNKEDMDYFIKTIEQNYPYLDMLERTSDFDWEDSKKMAYKAIKDSDDEIELQRAVSDVLRNLCNNHTELIYDKDRLLYYMNLYQDMPKNDYRYKMIKKIRNDAVYKHYNITENELKSSNQSNVSKKQEFDSKPSVQVSLLNDHIAYLYIPSMNEKWLAKKDREIIKEFLYKNSDTKGMIIDIRGNSGGDSGYWEEMLLPLIYDKKTSVTQYIFYKNGEYGNMTETEEIKNTSFSNIKFPKDEFKKLKYGEALELEVIPAKDSVHYKKPIYLLVDHYVYSSSEMMASFMKCSHTAMLIGERTGGDGIGHDPLLFALPNSGLVIRMSFGLGVDGNGYINEEVKTEPDIEVDNVQRIDGHIEIDECIQKAVEIIENQA